MLTALIFEKTQCAFPYFSKDNVRFCSLHLGHGEQEDINGHDAEGGCWSALQTVHLPHPTEHEVITDGISLSLCTCIKAIRPPRCDLLTLQMSCDELIYSRLKAM